MPPTDSIAELKGAVEAAARALRDGEPTEPAPTLDRPPKPDLGDYSSNAAMLLAGPLGDNPRAVAERLRGELEGSLGGSTGEHRPGRGRRPRLRQPLPLRRLVPARARRPPRRGRRSRPGADGRPGTDPGRVRLRQPDRSAARRRRPRRRLRRRGGAPAGGDRPPGRARVLHQRRRVPGDQLRPLDRRPHAGRGAARERLSGRVRGRAGRPDRGRGDRPGRPRGGRRPRHRADDRGGPRHPVALRGRDGHLVLGAQPLLAGRGRERPRQTRRGRPHLPLRRRALAPHHRIRRRQRPGADPLRRRADLPDARHRLPLGQAGARLRPADRRARRRPPRLHRPAARLDRGARRRPRQLRGA